MRLVSNSNNLNSLKLLLAAEFTGGGPLEVEWVAPGRDSKEVLPLLLVGRSTKLFHPTAAAIFIMQEGGWEGADQAKVASIESDLEMESHSLYPGVLSYLGSPSGSPALSSPLLSALSLLEPRPSPYLGGEALSPLDLLVWSDLYPLFTEPKLSKELSSKLPQLQAWFLKLSQLPQMKKATAKFGVGLEPARNSLASLYSPAASKSSQAAAPSSSTKGSGSPLTPSLPPAAPSAPSVTAAQVAAAKEGWAASPPQGKARPGPRLPLKGERNILITSALPYVNNVPHLGNIVGCVLSADVYARFARLRGYNVLYVCGTDEYGTSTETKAVEEGLTNREICDKYHALHKQIYEWFNISFDKFGRTTTEQQTEISQSIFWSLQKQSCTSQASVEQLYCAKCKKFLADRFVEGQCPLCGFEDARGDQCDACGKLINATELIKPRCKLCSGPPEVRSSKHLFLELPKVEGQLKDWLEKSSERWSSNARVIAGSWVKGGLQPRCITRDLVWGTKVPLEGFQDKVFYVWFDAPIGYISITAGYTEHWEKWWKAPPGEVEYWQFMAKDNVPFHSVVFPATLLGTGEQWTMVNRLMSTEYLNYEDAKFSKSRGVGVFGNDAQDTGIPSDVWRFYLMYIRPESQDSAFKWDDLMTKNNSELLANLGNFCNRATKFTRDNFSGKVPAVAGGLTEEDWELVARVNLELAAYTSQLEDAREREAISSLFSVSRLGNQLLQRHAPWKLVKLKTPEAMEQAGSVLGLALNIACLLSILIQPYMPDMAKKLQAQLQAPLSVTSVLPSSLHCFLPPGHSLGEPQPLVVEIKPETILKLKERYAGKQADRKVKEESKGAAKEPQVSPAAAATGAAGGPQVAELQEKVTEQGNKVRELKSKKASKEDVDREVKVLLQLKSDLAKAQGVESPAANKDKKGKKK